MLIGDIEVLVKKKNETNWMFIENSHTGCQPRSGEI
jgi:hypothetical protein